jgi:hypothetical protein
VKYPFLTDRKIEDAVARLLLKVFGETVPSPLDLDAIVYDHLCEREHLVFDNEQDLGEESGDIILGKTLPLTGKILITSRLTTEGRPGRYRFTLGHEIGHWVLHRPLFFRSVDQPSLFGTAVEAAEMVSLNRNVFPTGLRRAAIPPEEWQANRFAALLLVDQALLRDEFTRRFGPPPVARRKETQILSPSLRMLSRSLAADRTQNKQALQDLFGLSTEAMAIALETRGYVIEEAPLV